VTSSWPTKSVGIQYADESPSDSQVLLPPTSEAGVVEASTDLFPTYVWLCDRPVWPGNTTGSSLLRWLKLQPWERP
jgi:hypothetical protein